MVSSTNGSHDLRAYLDRYARVLQNVRYGHLRDLQELPFATVAHGGGGTVYALWRMGGAGSIVEDWLTRLLADRSRSAYGDFDRAGYLFGRAGVLAIDAMARGRSPAAYIRATRPVGRAPLELAAGIAGHLAGASILLARKPDAKLRAHAAELAAVIERRARRRTPRWTAQHATNFAHRWPGVVHALLGWAQLAGEASAWVLDALAGLALAWRPGASEYPHMRSTWCTGDAGAAMLFARGFEVTGDTRYLRVARRAAEAADATPPVASHLCCGIAGVAYSLLAVARIDRTASWRERASTLAVRAVTSPLASRWPNGLLWGHPGLACLALDLTAADRVPGFPLVEL